MDMWWIWGQRGCQGGCCSTSPDTPRLTCTRHTQFGLSDTFSYLTTTFQSTTHYILNSSKSTYLSGTVLCEDGLLKDRERLVSISVTYICTTHCVLLFFFNILLYHVWMDTRMLFACLLHGKYYLPWSLFYLWKCSKPGMSKVRPAVRVHAMFSYYYLRFII